ncbi:uncharacterized protein LOC141649368 [Silene latifolia]|uniref:uncharacterized protein LOC141649368 n=1 Tax=Silene latifolia TaxID=37657 RepID=UPI003D786408
MVPFQDTAAECDLQDLKSYGAFFTWNNKQPSDTRVFSRIDRALVNDCWLNLWTDYFATFSAEGEFDHCPCIISLARSPEFKKKPFKFFNMWCRAPEYHQVIQHNWNNNVYGTAMFRVVKRLKLMKSALKKLNGSLFLDIERNTDVAFKVMIHTQEELQRDPYNKQLMDIERQTRESYHLLATAKEEFLGQKAKCAWAKDGDVNSAMFHRLIKKRQLHNKVLQIQDAAGVVCKEPEDILNAFLSYYKLLLGSSAGSANVIQHILTNGPTVDCQL